MYFCEHQYISGGESDHGLDKSCKLFLGDGIVFTCPFEIDNIVKEGDSFVARKLEQVCTFLKINDTKHF